MLLYIRIVCRANLPFARSCGRISGTINARKRGELEARAGQRRAWRRGMGSVMKKKESRLADKTRHAAVADRADGEHSGPLVEDAVLFLDTDGRITVWSDSAVALTGISAREALGRPIGDFCPDIKTKSVLAEATRRGYAEFSGRCTRGDGGFMPVRAALSPSHDSAGAIIGFATVLTDGRIPAPAVFSLRATGGGKGGEPAVADGLAAPALLVDPLDRHILDASPAALAVLGGDAADLIGRPIDEILQTRGEPADDPVSSPIRRLIRLPGVGGRERAFEFSVLDVLSEGRETLLYCLHEVTHWVESKSELTRINLELSHLARHDHLTGLFNKPMFVDTLELANSRLERVDGLLGVLYIDLDGFKPVNDRHGHDTGDLVLVEVGGRLRGAVRTSDVMARLGGDEFGAILENLKTPRDALKVAELLIEVLSEPFIVDGKRITISASVGAVVANRRVPDSARLLIQADRMMYQAKKQGYGRAALEYLGETGALRDAVQ